MSEDIVLDDLKQQESSVYSVVKENEYELPDYSSVRVTKQSQPPVPPVKKSNYQKVWSAPMIAIIVLQCLIMVLLMVAIGMSGFTMSTKNSSCDLTCGNFQNVVQLSCVPNFTEWSDLFDKLSNNTSVTPNITEWADGIAKKVYGGNTFSFPNFTEWADGVAQNVIRKIEDNTPSFPNFTEWADHVTKNALDNLGHDILTFSNFTDVIQSVYHLLLANISTLSDSDALILSVVHEHAEVSSTYHMNNTYLMIKSKNDLIEKLNSISVILSNVQETSSSMASVVNDLLLGIEELLLLYNSSFNVLAQSCKEIKNRRFDSPSGMYLLKNPNNGSTYDAYCNMEELCGSGGGWTRLAYMNISDTTQNCPSGFRLYQSGGVRACGRPVTNSGSCVSVQFPSNGISYSQVCGRVVGYQYVSPDAADHTISGYASHNDINSYYVDGVSITRGSPRQHVWTLMAGLNEFSHHHYYNEGYFSCPCSHGSLQNPTLQSFIGNDYYCESGNPTADGTWQNILYTSDPLWDGKGCGKLEGNCCTAPGLPWFHKVLNTTTTDYLELRVCADQNTSNEDVPVSFYDLYVK